MWIQPSSGGEKLIEGVQVELVRKDLGDDWYKLVLVVGWLVRGDQALTFKQVFLSQHVSTLHDLFQQGLQDDRLV